jgi:CBS domain containing-hemolysin-like protein
MADLSAKEGQLAKRESEILKNLLQLGNTRVRDVMTPRTVLFSLPGGTMVAEFFGKHEQVRFSRIPVYGEDPDQIEGFVLRSDLLLAQAGNDPDITPHTHCKFQYRQGELMRSIKRGCPGAY